jgi:hypothetical protein
LKATLFSLVKVFVPLRFGARIKRFVDTLRGPTDGPNRENIRVLLTHVNIDDKLLPIDYNIGFNAIDDFESDAFRIIAAAREVAYLKSKESGISTACTPVQWSVLSVACEKLITGNPSAEP